MTRPYGAALAALDWDAVSAAERHIRDAFQIMSTSALGSVDRHLREIVAMARPIETDLGMERMLREQLQGYQDATRFEPVFTSWTDAFRSRTNMALEIPRPDRALAGLTDGLSSVQEKVATLGDDLGLKMRGDLKAVSERWQTALGDEIGRFGASYEELVAEATHGIELGEMLAGVASAPSVLGTIRDALSYLRDFAPDALAVSESGDVELNGEVVEIESLRADLTEVGRSAASAPEGQRFETWMQSLLRAAQRNPALALFIYLMLPILLNIAGNLLTPVGRQDVLPKPRTVQGEVSRAAQELNAQPAALRRLRIVLKPDLPAFNRQARKSGSVGTLPFGQIVTVLELRRNWTRVEWSSEGTTLRGWVLSRYLGRIQPEEGPPKEVTLPPEWTCD